MIQSWILGIALLSGQHAEMGMGFDQEKTVHHFVPNDGGGYIDIAVKDSSDAANRDAIRTHLQHIATLFKAGDFSIPMFIHDEAPDGVEVMKRLSREIDYSYARTAEGGRLTIKTRNKEAMQAIHAFLRYQIREHKTQPSGINGSTRPKPPAKPVRPGLKERR